MSGFNGFPKEAVSFLAALAQNNDKYWFEDHRPVYRERVLAPAQALVCVMGEKLQQLRPGLIADPRVDKSIFRLHRDTRFTKDKKPFKTHLGVYFWEGAAKKMECPGFYFHLEPGRLMLAAGFYMFPAAALARYRDTVVHPKRGPALTRIVERLAQAKTITVAGSHYKRTPRGYDPAHPNAALLLHNGLYAYVESGIPPELHSGKLVAHCLRLWTPMVPLHAWLVDMNEAGGTRKKRTMK